jgi:hypothetical protein
MPKSTLDSPAWKALSDGSQRLYIALKGKADNKHNTAYLSTRDAATALGRKRGAGRKIREWYAELQHYGFIVMLSKGCLGPEGVGKATHWRLTDKGTTRGGYEPPMQEFLKWDGELFDPSPYRAKGRKWEEEWQRGKTESRRRRERQGVDDVSDSPVADVTTPNGASVDDVSDLCDEVGVGDVITSINHYPGTLAVLPLPPKTPLKPSLGEFGQNDPRVIALDATEQRLRTRRSHNGKRRRWLTADGERP